MLLSLLSTCLDLVMAVTRQAGIAIRVLIRERYQVSSFVLHPRYFTGEPTTNRITTRSSCLRIPCRLVWRIRRRKTQTMKPGNTRNTKCETPNTETNPGIYRAVSEIDPARPGVVSRALGSLEAIEARSKYRLSF